MKVFAVRLIGALALLLGLGGLAPIARAQNLDTPPKPGAPRPLSIAAPVEHR